MGSDVQAAQRIQAHTKKMIKYGCGIDEAG